MLPPKELHKAIVRKTQLEARVIAIQSLAEELHVEIAELKATIEVLQRLHMVKVYEPEGAIQLTESGLLANID